MSIFQNINKKTLVIVISVFALFLLSSIFVMYRIKSSKPTTLPQVAITPIQQQVEINPSYKKNAFIPTYTPEKGSGVNLEAPLVTDSIREIQKLYPFLPYEKTLITPQNQEVAIVVPDFTSQPNRWTLQVDVFGLDYHLNKGDSEYATNKNAFVSAASSLNSWIKEKGADPKKIMIIWGDKEYIQNKSQELLE